MKKCLPIYFLILFSLIGFVTTVDAQDASTWMPDDNLRTVVRTALNLEADEPLTQDQMLNLTWLYVPQRSITNLTGLEHATNLVTLIIFRNQVVDIQPIGKLSKLIFLYVVNNLITDISPLDQLTRLRFLALQQNQISDVSTLENSEELEWLYLAGNPISDTSALVNLPKLSNTDLEIPSIITDPSLRAAVREALGIPANMRITPQAMQRLTNLNAANLGITSLAGLEHATQLESLSIWNNQVNDLTPIANLGHLTVLYAGSNLISGIRPLAKMFQLRQLELHQNQIRDISPLAHLMNLEVLRLAENPIIDTSLITNLPKSIDIDIRMSEPQNTKPVFTDGSSTTRSIAENTGTGVDIGSVVSATDADNDTLTYTLGGTDAASFSIDSSTGQLRTSASLDYETKDSHSVTVSVSDGQGGNNSISVTINITDLNESPVFSDGSSTTRAIAENVGAGINIGSAVSATDPDGDDLTYTLSGTDAATFSIDDTTGQLQTSATLDYETKSAYAVVITTSDGTLTETISVTITVTDLNEDQSPTNNPPVFTEGDTATRTIAENTASDVDIGTPVAATDADNNTLVYLLSGTDASSFSIDATTGQLQTNAALDFETKSSYTFTVSVTDGSATDTITVTITITDGNDAPILAAASTNLAIAENTASGTNIGAAFTATDPDGDSLTWTLGGTDAAAFGIDSTNGQLRTNTALDYETKASYSVTVSVSDGNEGTDSIAVTINVTDVNENRAPVFTEGSTATRSIAENTASGVNIGSPVSATDADNDTLTYQLGTITTDLQDADAFLIDTTTGQLQTNAALDFETKSSYSFPVFVFDGNGGSDEITVTITVTDVNENRAPAFSQSSLTRAITISTTTITGDSIGDPITATDADDDTLIYTLGGTDADKFSIGSSSGQLQVAAALLSDTGTTYSITVIASDDNGGSGSVSVTVNVIRATPQATNTAPVFSDGATTTRSVAENTDSGVDIGSAVSATDADNDTLAYMLGGTDASSFSIVDTTGQLQTNAVLDYETKSSYSVTVSVSDGNGGTDSIDVTINVTDVTEIDPPLSVRTAAVRDAIVAAVGVSDAADVTNARLGHVTSLNISNKSISTLKAGDFNGLTALTDLDLSYNDITDISELSGLTTLENLVLDYNGNLRDISPLSGLTSLTSLSLRQCYIFDLSPLSGLTLLTSLELGSNLITNISPLSGLTSLTGLNLSYNINLSTITALENLTSLTQLSLARTDITNTSIESLEDLTSLTQLWLNFNKISDLSPLEDLTSLTLLNLNLNSISDLSPLEGLTSLTQLGLSDNSISDVSPLEDLSLTQLWLDNNSISDLSPLEDLSLTVLAVSGNPLNAAPVFSDGDTATRSIAENTAADQNIGDPIAATDSNANYAPLQTLVANNPGIQIDISIPTTGDTLTYFIVVDDDYDWGSFSLNSSTGQLITKDIFNYEAQSSYSIKLSVSDGKGGTDTIVVTVNVTDVDEDTSTDTHPLSGRTQAVQDAIVASVLGVDAAEDVSAAHLADITQLNLWNKSITSLSSGDFDGLTSLTTLYLQNNQISDISPLAGLTTLTTLALSNNNISDISTLSGLTSLTSLSLSNNSISSITALEDLTSLTSLTLNNNSISSITALEDLTSLTRLELAQNQISDISTLEDLTSLTTLKLNGNSISNFSPVEELTSLDTLEMNNCGFSSVSDLPDLSSTAIRSLRLNSNNLSDVSGFPTWSTLRALYLNSNGIRNVSGISSVTTLTYLELKNNAIWDASPLTSLTALHTLKVSGNPFMDYGPLRTINNRLLNSLDINLNNNLPVFSDGSSTTRSIAENTASGTDIGAAVSATDADNNTITYSLEGNDAGSFSIDSSSGQLQTSASLDFETKSSYSVTIIAYDGKSGADSIDVTINITDVVGAAPASQQAAPSKNALLANYPNPFNPETWIPYHLAKPADVRISIYAADGKLVRILDLGRQTSGIYQSRSRAAYWDGKNVFGESVASGVYFYMLTAGDFTATRKMFIRK